MLRILVLFILVQTAGSIATVTVPVLARVAEKDVGVAAAYVGFFTALIYVTGSVTSLLAGTLTQRLGAVRISQVGLLVCALGLWLATIGSLPAIVLSALVIGIGYGPLTPAGSHVLAQVTPPERRSLVFSIKQTGVPAGPFVAGLAVPQIIILSGWQGALEAMAGVCALCAALLVPFRRQIDGMAPAPADGGFSLRRAVLDPLQRVLRHRMLRALMLVSFGLAGIQIVLSTFFVTYLTQSAGFSLAWAGLALSISQAAGVAGRIAWGAVADRVGARPVLYALAAGTCVAASLTAGMHAGWPLAAVLVVGAAFGATASGWNGVFLAEVARLAPKGEVAPVTSGVLTATYAGVITMPSLVSLVVGATGSWASAFGLAVAAVAVPMLMLVATARAEAREAGGGR